MSQVLISSRVTRIALHLINAALLVPLLTYTYSAIYIRYMADDYCLLASVRQNGVIGTVYSLYTEWLGRFVSSFVVAGALSLGWQISAILIMITFVLWWIALYGVLRYAIRKLGWKNPDLFASIGASIFLIVMFNSALSFVQSFYWISGIFSYTAPLTLATLYAWILAEWESRKFKRVVLVICGVLAFVAAGFSELYGLAQTAALIIALVLAYNQPGLRYRSPGLVAGLLGSVVGLGIIVIAPGNFIRLSLNTHLDLASLLLGSVASPVIVLWSASLYSVLTLFAILGIPMLAGLFAEQPKMNRINLYLIGLPILASGLTALCFALALYTTASPPPERAWIVPQFIMFCGLGVWSYLLGLKMRPDRRYRPRLFVISFVSVAIVVLLFFTSLEKALTVSEVLSRYAAGWDMQNSTMRVGGNHPNSLALAPMPIITGLVKLSGDRTVWAYRCAAVYYDIPAIANDPALRRYIEIKSLGWPTLSPIPN